MWEITKEFEFEAAHQLVQHDGACQRRHGHSYRGRVVVQGNSLHETGPKSGMVLDYGDISRVVKKMVAEYLDHQDLNETLETDCATAEVISQWCYNYILLTEKVPGLVAVEISETRTSNCRYSRPKEQA